jgi:hypothetical protein
MLVKGIKRAKELVCGEERDIQPHSKGEYLDITVLDHREHLKRTCRGGENDRMVLFLEDLILSDGVISSTSVALMAIREGHSIVVLSSITKSASGLPCNG